MSKVCQRCQRHAKLMRREVAGCEPEDLCKACFERAEIEDLLQPAVAPSPPPPIQGVVISSAGGVRGVQVKVQGQDGTVMTDSAGRFSLGDAATSSISKAASRLYGALTESDHSGGEKWLLNAAREGALPAEYEGLLRKSEVGALLNHDTFVGLLNRRDVAKIIAPRLFGAIREEPSLTLSFTKAGFAPFSLPVRAFAEGGPLDVRMQRAKDLGTIDPDKGGCVLDALTGASVTFAAGTRLVRSDGSPHEGEVRVCCSVLDVTDPKGLDAMPGDFSAVNVDGRSGQLESFGAMYVGLSAADGERLDLHEHSPGMALSFVSNAAATFDSNELPPSIYFFDEVSGKWKQDAVGSLEVEGVMMPSPGSEEVFVKAEAAPPPPRPKKMKKKGKGRGDEFHAMNHFGFVAGAQVWTKDEYEKFLGPRKMPRKITLTNISATGYWNCDRMMETSFVSGQIVDTKGDVVSVANVFSKGVRYSGASPRSGLTESGGFSVLTRCLSEFEVIVLVPVEAPVAVRSMCSGAPKGQASVRFKFGPFKTGQPGEELDIGELKLRRTVMVPPEDVQKQKILEVFDRWDEKGKGWISEEGMTAVLKRLGVSEDMIVTLFRAADVNEDGKIDYEEFTNWVVGSEENQKLIEQSEEEDEDEEE